MSMGVNRHKIHTVSFCIGRGSVIFVVCEVIVAGLGEGQKMTLSYAWKE